MKERGTKIAISPATYWFFRIRLIVPCEKCLWISFFAAAAYFWLAWHACLFSWIGFLISWKRMSRRLCTAQLNNSNQNSQRWRCAKCGKILSSKRSFDEHMFDSLFIQYFSTFFRNVHSGKRPFDCNQCKYSSGWFLFTFQCIMN